MFRSKKTPVTVVIRSSKAGKWFWQMRCAGVFLCSGPFVATKEEALKAAKFAVESKKVVTYADN